MRSLSHVNGSFKTQIEDQEGLHIYQLGLSEIRRRIFMAHMTITLDGQMRLLNLAARHWTKTSRFYILLPCENGSVYIV